MGTYSESARADMFKKRLYKMDLSKEKKYPK